MAQNSSAAISEPGTFHRRIGFLRYNPLLLAIELMRDILLWHRPVNLVHLGYIYATSLVLCYVGYAAFRRTRAAFTDVL